MGVTIRVETVGRKLRIVFPSKLRKKRKRQTSSLSPLKDSLCWVMFLLITTKTCHFATGFLRSSCASRCSTTTTTKGGFHNYYYYSSCSRIQQQQQQKRPDVAAAFCYDPNWKDSPAVNPVITFQTLLVPSSELTKWITHPQLQHRLAKVENWDFLKHVHPRIKMVQPSQDAEETNCKKQLLLLPNVTTVDLPSQHLSMGPPLSMTISSHQLSFQYLLQQLLPPQGLPAPNAYEQIGHVAHFNLKEHHLPYKQLIGEALLESTTASGIIKTVVNKVGQVHGKYRTYHCEILANVLEANKDPFETTVVEERVKIRLNVAECYWSTRLSGERQELLKDILHHHQGPKKNSPLLVADVFCGVGAICLLLAKHCKNVQILANDWNPKAIHYLQESLKANNLFHNNNNNDDVIQTSTQDSFDFLSSMEVFPHHVLMNYPLEGPQSLGALRWWSWKALEAQSVRPRFHVYTFAKDKDPTNVAINIVANELLPQPSDQNRQDELNQEFGANLSTRVVRDVAPGKVVVLVSFTVTPKLIRYMQGNYS